MTITTAQIKEFAAFLAEEERSAATIDKYCRDLHLFAVWLADAPLTKAAVASWKAALIARGYQPSTINAKLTAVGRWLEHIGKSDCKVQHLRLQRQLFRDTSRDLTRHEYQRLVATAEAYGKYRLALILQTICATGIRVSELRHITLEAAAQGRATISLKGKIRTILLPGKLARKLAKYGRRQRVTSGPLFLTRNGTPLSRKQIWSEMKDLCALADVEASKVFPHNLRHLFARSFYKVSRDLAQLADVLGHTSVETTRLYLITTSREHEKTLERLQLVS